MNKIVKEEKEVNLVIGARNVLAKLGTRKLAAVLVMSSMLAISGCGKKEEVQTASLENTVTDDSNKVEYRNRPLGGKIVDNHNQELYISKASDIEKVVKGEENNVEESNKAVRSTKNKSDGTNESSEVVNNNVTNASKSTTTTTSTTSTVTVDNNAVSQTGNEVTVNEIVEQPQLLEGESINYSSNGSYTVTPSQEYVNPNQGNSEPVIEEPPVEDIPVVQDPPNEEIPDTPPVVEENKGYVVLKKNYSDGTYFYSFTANNGDYTVQLNSLEYSSDLSDINSNIYALAENDEALSYAIAEGWAKVGIYNEAEYGYLDSVYNMEAVCDSIVADALKAIEDADKALTLTPEN